MTEVEDRLYDLLPSVHRTRDAALGEPLKALLGIIAEQADVVERDIAQLYENWFIETCQDWVVPYLGDLVGYQAAHDAGAPGDVLDARGRQRNAILVPRRDVANTIKYRRRKGTLSLLEDLAHDVAGWPALVVELYRLLGVTQALNFPHPDRGLTVDLRRTEPLDRLAKAPGAFDPFAHTVDVRRTSSRRTAGRYNIPSVALFVWRLKTHRITEAPAYCVEPVGPQHFTFSVLGNDTALVTRHEPEADAFGVATELNVPAPIRRRALSEYPAAYYDPQKSFAIWAPDWPVRGASQPIPRNAIIVADLSDRTAYRTPNHRVAVDPELGRILFPQGQLPRRGVRVTYHTAFSADMGGGEYDRPIQQPANARLYRVVERSHVARRLCDSIEQAVERWTADAPTDAVIEIARSRVYSEPLKVTLKPGQTLQIRAANGARPVIRLLDRQADRPDSLLVELGAGSRFTLDGLLVAGRGIRIEAAGEEGEPTPDDAEGYGDEENGDDDQDRSRYEAPSAAVPAVSATTTAVAEAGAAPADQPPAGATALSPTRTQVTIRHCTLVPGWDLDDDCEPRRPAEASLELVQLQGRVEINHTILGSILLVGNEVRDEPLAINLADSILDATDDEREALSASGGARAHAVLTARRSTVFGTVETHAVDLAENTIFTGTVRVARRQRGCMRFCYVPPGSRTPRRYHCQPDLVERAVLEAPGPGSPIFAAKTRHEQDRVRPRFNSQRYGGPTYAQLAHACAHEIARGADDESEMGAFHDLFQPQRAANLRARLDEYTPAEMGAGVIFAS